MCWFFCFWATAFYCHKPQPITLVKSNGLSASITASKQLITLNRYAFLLPRDRPEISFYCRFDLLFLATIPVAKAKAKAYSFKIVQAFKMTHTPLIAMVLTLVGFASRLYRAVLLTTNN